MNAITRYCSIEHKALWDGETCVYEDTDVSLEEFAEHAFRYLNINYPRFYRMERLAQLGVLAAEIVLRGSKVSQWDAGSIAVVLSNAHASLDTDLRYFETTKGIASPALFVYTLSNIVTGEICIRHGLKGENAFFVTPSFDPVLITAYVDDVLKQSSQQACIAGWVDVMGEHHDVFLYLVEKASGEPGELAHDAKTIEKLYLS